MPQRDDAILFVDLDGTLIREDSFHMTVWRLLPRAPLYTALAFLRLFKGRAWVKDRLARRWVPGLADCTLNPAVRSFIEAEKKKGRTVVLATAANYRIAERFCHECALFDRWIASDAQSNRKGAAKLEAMRLMAGENLFDYIGDSRADIPILQTARNGYVTLGGALAPFDDASLERLR